ncbi:MAG: restriction endonuclease [candidate division Zixibacteria bacterium]|nr:restriction endonuclease [Candidatus Tariuqbacter arcticus]
MALSLKESRSVADMAELLYDFLPGSGDPKWKGHLSFKTVAEKVGVSDFWQPGSKIPMITALIERTLEFRRGRFEPLILEIVRAGLVYRQKQGNPFKPEEIDRLNGLILEIGFKFPDLWDPDFKALLRDDGTTRAEEHVERAIIEEKLKETERSRRSQELEKLKKEFFLLHDELNRQKAGLLLEKILNRLFYLHDLNPREPFRVEGEQIDGSFELDHEIYLLEAKWTSEPCSEADLLIFRGKIEGKSKYTRGVFISINGISKGANTAITKGKQAVFFIADGYDLTMILEDNISLVDFLRLRQRLLADEGNVLVPFNELRF